ncbi:hypothetical protein CYMTET_23253 [Cymbomonas tetramitiformis]|uniref:Uncharacterized protein n=1 Tax=Cymbomonas tetramitiformis TaxID=36881 RepID=A0AAE0FYB5_9CHLO|nr:hypothetical protein CYMTET_23253 [Cymbomonas tetramitiformis]
MSCTLLRSATAIANDPNSEFQIISIANDDGEEANGTLEFYAHIDEAALPLFTYEATSPAVSVQQKELRSAWMELACELTAADLPVILNKSLEDVTLTYNDDNPHNLVRFARDGESLGFVDFDIDRLKWVSNPDTAYMQWEGRVLDIACNKANLQFSVISETVEEARDTDDSGSPTTPKRRFCEKTRLPPPTPRVRKARRPLDI